MRAYVCVRACMRVCVSVFLCVGGGGIFYAFWDGLNRCNFLGFLYCSYLKEIKIIYKDSLLQLLFVETLKLVVASVP